MRLREWQSEARMRLLKTN